MLIALFALSLDATPVVVSKGGVRMTVAFPTERTWWDPSDALSAAIRAAKDMDYTTASERFHDVLAVEPLNTKAAAGLGYALFLAKDYRASVAASRMALAFDPDKAQRGAIGFNLGKALEALGDKTGARKAYIDSLTARPNATVQKHLDALD